MNLKTYFTQERKRAADLARQIGVTEGVMSCWRNGHKPISVKSAMAIERATGNAVTCEEMRPDINWPYVRASNG